MKTNSFYVGKIKACCMLVNLIDRKIHDAGEISISKSVRSGGQTDGLVLVGTKTVCV